MPPSVRQARARRKWSRRRNCLAEHRAEVLLVFAVGAVADLLDGFEVPVLADLERVFGHMNE